MADARYELVVREQGLFMTHPAVVLDWDNRDHFGQAAQYDMFTVEDVEALVARLNAHEAVVLEVSRRLAEANALLDSYRAKPMWNQLIQTMHDLNVARDQLKAMLGWVCHYTAEENVITQLNEQHTTDADTIALQRTQLRNAWAKLRCRCHFDEQDNKTWEDPHCPYHGIYTADAEQYDPIGELEATIARLHDERSKVMTDCNAWANNYHELQGEVARLTAERDALRAAPGTANAFVQHLFVQMEARLDAVCKFANYSPAQSNRTLSVAFVDAFDALQARLNAVEKRASEAEAKSCICEECLDCDDLGADHQRDDYPGSHYLNNDCPIHGGGPTI